MKPNQIVENCRVLVVDDDGNTRRLTRGEAISLWDILEETVFRDDADLLLPELFADMR